MFRFGRAVAAHGDELAFENLEGQARVLLADYTGLKSVSSAEFELSLDRETWAHEIEVDMTGLIDFPIHVRAVTATSGKVTVTDA